MDRQITGKAIAAGRFKRRAGPDGLPGGRVTPSRIGIWLTGYPGAVLTVEFQFHKNRKMVGSD